MNEKIPRVLILLSTYNGEQFLYEQLESLHKQNNVIVHVLIRDDGSTDGTDEVVRQWKEKLNIVYYKEENIGPLRSFMRLVELASLNYDFYAYCDQDDYWEDIKLQMAIGKLEKYREDVALYYSRVKRIGQSLEDITDPYKKVYHTEDLQSALLVTEAPGCTMVYTNKMLEKLKEYAPGYSIMHDEWTLKVCAALGGKIVYDAHSYILYRQHERNVVGGIKGMQNCGIKRVIRKVEKFFDFSYKPSVQAIELLNGYEIYMEADEKRILKQLVESKDNMCKRLQYLLTKRIRCPYSIYNIKFIVQVLCNRY